MRNKGQGLSLTVIVIAVLALIVLVVMIAIFTGKIRIFGESAESCVTKGGSCVSGSAETCEAQNMAYIPRTDCDKDRQVCCVKVYS